MPFGAFLSSFSKRMSCWELWRKSNVTFLDPTFKNELNQSEWKQGFSFISILRRNVGRKQEIQLTILELVWCQILHKLVQRIKPPREEETLKVTLNSNCDYLSSYIMIRVPWNYSSWISTANSKHNWHWKIIFNLINQNWSISQLISFLTIYQLMLLHQDPFWPKHRDVKWHSARQVGRFWRRDTPSVSSFYVTSFDKVDNRRCRFQFRNILLLVETT